MKLSKSDMPVVKFDDTDKRGWYISIHSRTYYLWRDGIIRKGVWLNINGAFWSSEIEARNFLHDWLVDKSYGYRQMLLEIALLTELDELKEKRDNISGD